MFIIQAPQYLNGPGPCMVLTWAQCIYIYIHTHISTHTCVAAILVFGPCAMRAQTIAKMIEIVRRLDSGSAAGYASVLVVGKL